MSAAPRVTVLSAVYNDAAFVREAIESVLAQTFTDFEYLIINDAAIDDSRAIAASYRDPRIRIVDNEENLGLTRSLNRGLALARGELIARFDSNDVCYPERLAKQVAFLDSHPEVAVVGVQAKIIDVAGRRLRGAGLPRPTTDLGIRWYCMFETPFFHSGTMYRRSVVYEELGGYDETFRIGQDAELWLRVARHHQLANLSERLIASRADPLSITGTASNPHRAALRERWKSFQLDVMRRHLQWDDVPEEWVRLWIKTNDAAARLSPEEVSGLVDFLERVYERFVEVHPDAAGNREIRRHRAFQFSRALEKAVLVDRARAIPLFFRVARGDWRAAVRRVSKTAIVFVAGEAPLRAWRSRRSRAAARRRSTSNQEPK